MAITVIPSTGSRTNCEIEKNSTSDPFGLCLRVGILGVFMLLVVGASFGQQPPTENLEPVPARTRTPELSDETKNDPLFQEIQRIVLQGVRPDNSGQTPGNVGIPTPKEISPIDSISDTRWHAIESILAAARMLEKDVFECTGRSDLEGALKFQAAIKNLRRQAMDLLR